GGRGDVYAVCGLCRAAVHDLELEGLRGRGRRRVVGQSVDVDVEVSQADEDSSGGFVGGDRAVMRATTGRVIELQRAVVRQAGDEDAAERVDRRIVRIGNREHRCAELEPGCARGDADGVVLAHRRLSDRVDREPYRGGRAIE